jgi:hypothetical protein
MRTIGTIDRLQIQRSSLKTGEKPDRVYDPTPLLPVPRLTVTPDGVLGASDDGGWLVDVHHRAHPATKNEDALHGVSVGFTSHYAAMRARFGERMVVGCAGENIIVTTDRMFTYDDLAAGVVIVASDGTLYINDSDNFRIRVVTSDGIINSLAGNPSGGGAVSSDVPQADLIRVALTDQSRNVLFADSVARREDQQPLDRVSELPDVARPVELLQS